MLTLPTINYQNLITPEELIRAFPCRMDQLDFVKQARIDASHIIKGQDKRLLVIVGPCSIHDEQAALEYATLLKQARIKYENDLYIIMRNYFQKPRTTLGWKGLINDPYLNNSYNINDGLKLARKILLQLNTLEIPCATEFLDPFINPYLDDLIAWTSVGARTVESQPHRELASGLTMPVGFKNNTDGNMKVAIDAVLVANQPHCYIGLKPNGSIALISTDGNQDSHIILRGSSHATNYENLHVSDAVIELQQRNLNPHVMIDCSHGNSMKNYKRQHDVVKDIALQLTQGSKAIIGVMLESHLIAGKQQFIPNTNLVYGQSITDSCMSWDETIEQLEKLAQANHKRNNT